MIFYCGDDQGVLLVGMPFQCGRAQFGGYDVVLIDNNISGKTKQIFLFSVGHVVHRSKK